MARSLRINFEGALYHVMSRGNKKDFIFLDEKDRENFIEIFTSVVEKYHFICHAYCLMDNHYHLLIETPNANLSEGLRQLNSVYTQRFNKRHNTVGHLFQGRFKSILIDKDNYFLEAARYIVLNPVRAGIVDYPWEYKWSSYNAVFGNVKKPKFLCIREILEQLDKNINRAKQIYKSFILEGISGNVVAVEQNIKGGIILGKDRFVAKMEKLIDDYKTAKEIPRKQRFTAKKSLNELFDNIIENGKMRNALIYNAYINNGYTLQEIGDYLKIHYSTVSRIIKGVRIQKTRLDP